MSPETHRRRLRRQPAAKRPLIHRAYTPFDDVELDRIDRWGFTQHIRNRADVVRALVMKALTSEQKANAQR
jgi:hypothetical protein